MATTTEVKNGVQAAADETSRATSRAFEALSDYYLSAFDAGLKLQTRAIESAKLMLDESAALQRANRKLAEELLQSGRKAQQDLAQTVETNLKAAQAAWLPTDRR